MYQQGDCAIIGLSFISISILCRGSIMRYIVTGLGCALAVLCATLAMATTPEKATPKIEPEAAAAKDNTPSSTAEKAQSVSAPAPGPDGAAASTDPRLASLQPDLPERVKRPPPPPVTLSATIDLATQRMTVSEYGKAIHTWKISSGRMGHLTPAGRFRPQWRSRMWYSRQYDGSPMPYAVFFNGGIATHGTSAVYRLGRPASHGCVRLHTSNARTFYNLVGKHGNYSTRIVVVGRANTGSKRIARSHGNRSFRAGASNNRRLRANNGNHSRSSGRSIRGNGVTYVRTPDGYRVIYTQPSRVSRYRTPI